MLNLGAEQTLPLVDKGRIPKIRMLDENNVRKGFFDHNQFLTVRAALPEYLRGFVTIAYKEGWRLDEIETLIWDQVDRKLGIIRLEPGDTKNDDARVAYLDDEEKEIIAEQWELRKQVFNKRGKLLPWVFLNRYGSDRIKQFLILLITHAIRNMSNQAIKVDTAIVIIIMLIIIKQWENLIWQSKQHALPS